MRWLTNIVLALMIAGLLGGAAMLAYREYDQQKQRNFVRDEVRRFQREINVRGALREGSLNERGYPTTIDPHWFAGDVPRNPLLGPSHPWVELAELDERDLDHPRNWAVFDSNAARFWYNGYRGIVRARVGRTAGEDEARQLYEYVNEASLKSADDGPDDQAPDS